MRSSTVLGVVALSVLVLWLAMRNRPSGTEGCFAPLYGGRGGQCEGYWSADVYPVPHKEPWCGKAAFMKDLARIEASDVVQVQHQRGLAQSRIDSSFLGNEEYHDTARQQCWTGDLREHYVGEYNVVPTKDFIDYVAARAKDL